MRSRYDWMNAVALSVFPIAAVLGLILSLPRFVEGLLSLPGNAAIENLAAGTATPDTVDTLIKSRERALGLVDRGRYRSELSAALVLRAKMLRPDERKKILDRAVADAESGVAAAPADAFAWHHLAQASLARDGANRRAVDAELSSIAVGPYETQLLVPRLDLLFAARIFLDEKFDETVDDQIRVAWRREPDDVVRAVRRHGAADIVRRALSKEPSMLPQNFDDYLSSPNIR